MSIYHICTICPSAPISSKEEKWHSALPMQAGSIALLILPNSNSLALWATEWSYIKKSPNLFVLLRRTHRIDRKAGILPPYPSTAPAEIRVCSSWSSTTVTLCWKSLKRKEEKTTLFSFKVSKILLLSSRPSKYQENLLIAKQENLEILDAI